MKNLFLLFALCFFTATSINAQYSLTVADPNRTAYQTQGIITEPVIEITPHGAYAQVDMIFKINANQSSYSPSKQLEATLQFDLPNGSYIHDSWLWLDATNIIKADVVEKNRAITIYEGIVNRRRDPSLLIKTGENSYKLNVYPLRTDYARKIKLTYSVPVSWRNNQMIVELPIDMIRTSATLPDMPVKINHNGNYTSPDLVEEPYNKYLLSASSSLDVLMLYGHQYNNTNNFNISFTPANPNSVTLNTYPINATEGVYELTIPPGALGSNSIRNTAILIDHHSSYAINSVDALKQYIRTALLTNYNSTDSFNIFFSTASGVTQVYSSWQPIEKPLVDSAINIVPGNLASSSQQLEELFKQSLAFCGTKPGNETQAILFSSDYSYTNDQKGVDKLFDNVKKHIGSFNNSLNVINYSTYARNIFGVTHKANDILYNKFILAAGGSLFKYNKYISTYINNKYAYIYDLNVENALREIASNSGISTNSYNINIPVNNGFTYSKYNVYNKTKLNTANHFIEIGKYTGNIPNGTSVSVQVNLQGGNINQQHAINIVGAGDPTYTQSWTHKYIEDLIQLNNQAYVQEVIDSSINNRVLCDYTAFLAVETGDTIATNFDDNPNVLSVKNATTEKTQSIKCYPNPFTGALTIEVPQGTLSVEIFDLMGRKVFALNIPDGETNIKWNGKDSHGNELPNGVYMVIAKGEDARHTTKVMKQ
ncbi:MAG: T9SS type A sorting domain-containing protein [Chitinophagales bacterium]|nr:T9SS type A sorting domain-containing protein [Chitinophagaceae bacterium]MCB9064876.1 T9SS type A sorting domain-containing protein [Chitinophagales bacterium]